MEVKRGRPACTRDRHHGTITLSSVCGLASTRIDLRKIRTKDKPMNARSSPEPDIAYLETNEHHRLNEAREKGVPWKRRGPYLSERQRGTVREDYSQDGSAWDSSVMTLAIRVPTAGGEDGLAGISDDKQQLCVAIAQWNSRDSILKGRLFNLTNTRAITART